MAQGQAARRREYLDEIADEALAEVDAAAARKVELSEAAAVAEVEKVTLTAEKDRLAAARSQSLASAEPVADALVEALASVLEYAALERHVCGKLKTPQIALNHTAVERRLSNYLAVTLRRLATPQAPRWGVLGLPPYSPMDGRTWVQEERRQTGERMEEEGDEQDDQQDDG